MDKLKSMSIFVAVAEEEGFAPAARRLNMSPPSITRAISDLEESLGTRLLNRTTRTVELTEVGKRYLADCRHILGTVEQAERQAAGIHAAPSGPVFITAPMVFGKMILTPTLLEVLKRFPEISISTLFADRVLHIVNEGIDIAVRIGELPDSSLNAIRVGSVRRVLCASPNYLDKRGRPKTPSDLEDHDLINYVNTNRSSKWHFEKGGENVSVDPRSRLQLNVADAAISATIGEYGITSVLYYMVANHINFGSLEVVLENYELPPLPIHIVHKETSRVSAHVRAVIDHFVESLRKNPVINPPKN